MSRMKYNSLDRQTACVVRKNECNMPLMIARSDYSVMHYRWHLCLLERRQNKCYAF